MSTAGLFFAVRRFLLRVLLLTAVMLHAPVFAQAPADEVREELETGIIATNEQRARIYFQQKAWDRLHGHALRWLGDFPGESEAWRYLATAHEALGKISDAADAYLRAWELSTKRDFRIIERIGDIYTQTKAWDKAVSAYQTAVALRPKRAQLWSKLSSASLRTGNVVLEEKIEMLKKTLNFGQYVNELERWRVYTELLEAANAADDNIDETELRRAHLHMVRLEPGNLQSWQRLYEIAKVRKDIEEVEKIVRQISRIDPGNPYSSIYLGRQALAAGEQDVAVEYFEKALTRTDITGEQKSDIYLTLANLKESPQEALGLYKQAVLHNIKNFNAWEHVVVILRGLNQLNDSTIIYKDMERIRRFIENGKIVPLDLKNEVLGRLTPVGARG